MLFRTVLGVMVLLLGLLPAASSLARDDLERDFGSVVRPFLASYCVGCHGKDRPKGQLDLSQYTDTRQVVRDHKQWETVGEMLSSREMPPEKATRHPDDPGRASVVDWIERLRRREALRNAGATGPVLPRRLSNAEYDYTIRDLLGVDIRPTREFPVDPANEAGFDNSGESLAMSPALLKKYLEAAKGVAEHLVLKPSGFSFATHPVVSETERDKYAVLRIVDFYERQPTDLADYFRAAWRFKHRAALGSPEVELAQVAAQELVSARYLPVVWAALAETAVEIGPLHTLQKMWRELPAPTAGAETQLPGVRAACEKMRDYVVNLREKLGPRWRNLQLKGVGVGSQPFVLWRNRQYATHRRSFDPGVLFVPESPELKAAAERRKEMAEGLSTLLVQLRAASTASLDAYNLRRVVAQLQHRFATFADGPRPGHSTRERGAPALRGGLCPLQPGLPGRVLRLRTRSPLSGPPQGPAAQGPAAGGRLPQHDGLLPGRPSALRAGSRPGRAARAGRALAGARFHHPRPHPTARRLHLLRTRGGAEIVRGPAFDFARSEDPSTTTQAGVRRLATAYLARARESLCANGGDGIAIPVLEDFFKSVATNIRRAEQDRLAARAGHLQALVALAGRAYRRPLTRAEEAGLVAFYRSLRDKQGLDHEQAMRDSVASVLVSPHFLYRLDLEARSRGTPRAEAQALASRLSYFLWSSLPDAELLARAAAGDLVRPEVLVGQARRMLRDDRARALAVEFGGNWLEFRRFEEHNSVDRERFPAFDNELRQAMFEEPVHFLQDLVREDCSVLDLLYAKHTFVNAPLARHYGMPAPAGGSGRWVRVDDADRYQRGGILPMAVFLTKNAPGLRTSPVKRGYWVVRRLLGEQIPAPPAQVPDLPNDERKMGDLTLREVLVRHREDKACAGCHARFDSFGLAFEGFGPVGESRSRDLGGRAVDSRASFPGGSEGEGVPGLRGYLREHRQADFLDNFSRKLLSYALSRSLILSDEPLLDQMRLRLRADGYRFGGLIEQIVTSPQFLRKRSGDELAQRDN